MARPEPGKTYLIVTCRRCHTGFRVMDTALEEAQPRIDEPQRLTCRGCGYEDVYDPYHMRPASFVSKW